MRRSLAWLGGGLGGGLRRPLDAPLTDSAAPAGRMDSIEVEHAGKKHLERTAHSRSLSSGAGSPRRYASVNAAREHPSLPGPVVTDSGTGLGIGVNGPAAGSKIS